jgi:ribosome-associated translation inhibitor RaiA
VVDVEISRAEIPEKLEIEEEVRKFLEKFKERWDITSFRLDVDTYSPGGRKKYSMHAKVKTSDVLFIVKASGWDVPSTLKLLFERLEKKIGKKLKKKKEEKIEIPRKLMMKKAI